MLLTLLAFVIVLGVLILVHEFGHFITAKIFGVKVLEFAIGFPPRVSSFKKRETKYTIGLLPLGGYVSMLGEDESSKDPRAYNNATPGKRFLIGIAGVVLNVVLAWVLLTIGFSAGMTPIATPSDQIPGKIVKPQIFIAEVENGSAADKGGIKIGDQLIGTDRETFQSMQSVADFTKKNAGKTVVLKISENNSAPIIKTVSLTAGAEASLGIGMIDQGVVKVVWYKAPVVALRESYEIIKYTFSFLGGFVKQLFTTATISDNVGGPVAIYSMTGVAARAGIIVFLQFIAVLSLNLALINILPLPALDGGRAFFIILEKIFGKRIVKEEDEGIIHTIGFAVLILFILAVTYKDIVRLVHK